MAMKLEYHEGPDGLLYPNLTIPGEDEEKTLGKYGKLRQKYLLDAPRKSSLVQALVLKGQWWTHLWEVDEQAQKMEDELVSQMAAQQGVTEALKAENQLLWVQQMNNLMQAAQETVLNDLIYQ